MANEENVRKWVAALRSGEYSQASNGLRGADGIGYCCLGVACDISELGEWDGVVYRVYGGLEAADAILPMSVANWLGLACTNPTIDDGSGEHDAVSANDSLEWNFERIADAVERTYLA